MAQGLQKLPAITYIKWISLNKCVFSFIFSMPFSIMSRDFKYFNSFPQLFIVVYYFWRATITNSHRVEDIKQQKSILRQFWRPKVWNQGVGRAMLSLKVLWENPSLPLPAVSGSWTIYLTCGSITLIIASVLTWPSSLYLCICLLLF